MMTGDVEGRPYRDQEVLDLCAFLLIAGLDNTAFGIRATLRHLAVHQEHLAAVVADPAAGAQPGRAVASPVHAGDGARAHREV